MSIGILNYRDAKDIADSFFTGDCLQVGLTSPPKAVTLVPNAIKYLVKFVPYIREAKDFAVLRNTNKYHKTQYTKHIQFF